MLWLGKWLKILVAWLDLAILTLWMLLLALLPPSWVKGFYPVWFHRWCRCFVRALNVDLRLYQQHKAPLPDHYVLIANHPSAFEDVGIPALFPVRSLAKMEVKDWWLVGRIAVAAGTLFVQRESSESRKAAQQALIDVVRAGANICIYPEGGCKGRRVAPRFFNGPFVASFETGVPILPVFLHYEAQQAFEWGPGEHLLQKMWRILTSPNNRANCYVFDPINPTHFSSAEAMKEHAHRLYMEWQKRYLI